MKTLTLFALPEGGRQTLEKAGVTVLDEAQYDPSQAGSIDAILGWNDTGRALVEGPNQVQFIQTMSAGVDYLPLKALAAQHILVANTAGIHAVPIAESVTGMMLAFARGLYPLAAQWETTARDRMWTAAGKTAVVFGTGHIGQAIAQHLDALGMTVNGVSRHGEAKPGFAQVATTESGRALCQNAQVIVNVMPLTPATHHYFDHSFFAHLTSHPLFINVGRGPSVDTAALIEALENHWVSGAALDVFEQEPLPADSGLWTRPDVLVTPHLSGTVEQLRQQVFNIFWPNLQQLMATGTLRKNQVDLAAGY
ncbi:NAD(P)-dependent oxidoreductase [Lacticaseibacillus yichunensis]|uniref:NAD(P)-dependent oxidoreductase n=1 Tax=Lacticaseibacillus yichunensis TaxID=2486015 RepID=A0ABW4CPN9_9LACO|nr:NAD(P)-dependent oxidoreductase [Lacticaseibacillus yichunensis]